MNDQPSLATKLRLFWHKNQALVITMIVVLLAISTVGVIWYIRQSQQPLAPTAPPSKPRAGELVCSLDTVVGEECVQMEELDTNDENSVQFKCEGLPGTDRYTYYVRYSKEGEFEALDSSTASESAAITLDDYTQVYCLPCAGDYCASNEQALEDCSYLYEAPEPTPSPTPTPECNSDCTSNDDCLENHVCTDDGFCRLPACSEESDCECNPTAGFVIEKFHDLDGDGSKDSNEPGLDWNFEWQLDGDDDWQEYETYASKDGRGGNIDDLDPDDTVVVREKLKNGWETTTDREVEVNLEAGKRQLVVFGNWQPPSSATPTPTPTKTPTPTVTPAPTATPTPTPPEKLPEAGSTTQTALLIVAGLAVMAFGWRFILR